ALRRRFGSLEAFEVPAEPRELCVVLLHGYGADGADLVPVAAQTPGRGSLRWIFPEAPFPLDSSPFSSGRQWFPIDEEALLACQRSGESIDLSAQDPPGLRQAAARVLELAEGAGLDWDRVVLGGFSQGAMVAFEAAVQAPAAPAGLALFSGNLIAENRWRQAAAARKGVPFFQSHGRADPILGFQGALRLERLLREAGLRGGLSPFDGGHGIGAEVLEGFGSFLDSLREGIAPSRP
ncbi:MAG: esterase, partial [Elusimicrobia bacterium]|nr:esterase [Elusimicrobiota bacterium]